MDPKIVDRIRRGDRLTPSDAVSLFGEEDVHALAELANEAKRRRHGSVAYYVRNMHLNYTNICIHSCKFCGFARKPGEKGGWEMDVERVLERAEQLGLDRLTEVHIVGGLNPSYPYEYYPSILRALKGKYPGLHIKAFTATEIDFISRIGKRDWERTLADLKQAGLDSMPGGGAEIFSSRVWSEVCDRKTPPERWLAIHETAHRMGIPSTCTMLYGHIETIEERVEHMRLIRDLQDRTQGFTAFVPIAFQPGENDLRHVERTTGIDDLRTHAIARLFLDNVPHIKAYWVTLGPKMAQVLLSCGADDIDGMICEERIMHMSGAGSPVSLTEEQLTAHIREAGLIPVQRDSLYRPLKVWN